ncbi:MAG: hypothetical protein IJ523_11390 [Succinivibrionaceae bacterium]|nr:hypothetical protein [Succinivibrionaceae bacterium]
MKARFSKICCHGCDYAVVDAVTQRVFLSQSLIGHLADRREGIGFERIAVVEPPYDPDLDFYIRVYNASGQEVKDCVGGIGCGAMFADRRDLTVTRRPMEIGSLCGHVTVRLEQDGVHLSVPDPVFQPSGVPFRAQSEEKTYILQVLGRNVFCSVLAVGSPYCIVEQKSEFIPQLPELAGAVSSHERFPEGCSVGFCRYLSRAEISISPVPGVDSASTALAAALAGIRSGTLDESVSSRVEDGCVRVGWHAQRPDPALCILAPRAVYDGEIEI